MSNSVGQRILDEIIRQPMFRMECPAHPEAGCLAIWNGNTAEQIEAIVADSLRPRYHVIKGMHGKWEDTRGWNVTKEGMRRAVKCFRNKPQAVDFANNLARKNKGHLFVHLANGMVERHLQY